jgi:hypothetical protein
VREGTRTPEELAGRVVDRIQRRLDRHAEKDVRKAIRGIAKALRKAFRETLGLLRATVENPDGGVLSVERLGRHLLSRLSDLEADTATREIETSAAVTAERSFSLQVTTRDGDVATIHLDSSVSTSRSLHYGETGDGFSLTQEGSTLRNRELGFRVEGELDEEEMQAIRELVAGAERISNRFYAGDVEKALDKALQLGFDTDEIAGYSLDLNQRIESRATVAYREVMELAGEEDASPSRDAGDCIRCVRDYFGMREPRLLFRDGGKMALDLLLGALDSGDKPTL